MADGEPALKVAFVGQRVYFEQCSLLQANYDLIPTFVDFRAGAATGPLLRRLQELDPDIVLVFRPEIIPQKLFAPLRAVTIGYLTEPLPRTGSTAHADLQDRLRWLEDVDPGNFDRIISFDPLIAETATSVLPVWRSLPIPVADHMFMDVHERSNPARLLFVGRSTEHREELLAPVKARHPIIHIGHGLFGAGLVRLLRCCDIQLNLHNNPYPTFENRISVALAAGHLVISEPLSPTHALRPGTDFLQIATPESLGELVDELVGDPGAFLDVQRAGREQAERFRASTVYRRLVADAMADVAAHGSGRHRG